MLMIPYRYAFKFRSFMRTRDPFKSNLLFDSFASLSDNAESPKELNLVRAERVMRHVGLWAFWNVSSKFVEKTDKTLLK